MGDLQQTGQGKLYVNQSETLLTPYYRVLWYQGRPLQRMGKMFPYYVSSATLKIKIQETSQPLSIMHASVL